MKITFKVQAVDLYEPKEITIKSIKQAEAIVGGLTKTSKMPSLSLSIPARECRKGSKLREIAGSVCSGCYAMKGCYSWKSTQKAQYRRLYALESPLWVKAMVYLLEHKKAVQSSGVFRWHDSGDLQSLTHFEKVLEVVRRTPTIRHWLPTKESELVKNYGGELPKNLVIRLSGSMIDGNPPSFPNTSTVTTSKHLATCRAFENNGECGTCRKCWDSTIENVVYFKH